MVSVTPSTASPVSVFVAVPATAISLTTNWAVTLPVKLPLPVTVTVYVPGSLCVSPSTSYSSAGTTRSPAFPSATSAVTPHGSKMLHWSSVWASVTAVIWAL